jgi:hypothetical protein
VSLLYRASSKTSPVYHYLCCLRVKTFLATHRSCCTLTALSPQYHTGLTSPSSQAHFYFYLHRTFPLTPKPNAASRQNTQLYEKFSTPILRSSSLFLLLSPLHPLHLTPAFCLVPFRLFASCSGLRGHRGLTGHLGRWSSRHFYPVCESDSRRILFLLFCRVPPFSPGVIPEFLMFSTKLRFCARRVFGLAVNRACHPETCFILYELRFVLVFSLLA